MSYLDEFSKDVLAADDGTAPDLGKTFPDFPGEKPSKTKLIDWLDTWEDDLGNAGFSALMRGDIPHDVAKLKDRDLLSPQPNAAHRSPHQRYSQITQCEAESADRSGKGPMIPAAYT